MVVPDTTGQALPGTDEYAVVLGFVAGNPDAPEGSEPSRQGARGLCPRRTTSPWSR